MPELRFEWDEHALMIPDPDHPGQDDRFILLGLSAVLRVLAVCHGCWGGGDVIRLISARKADNLERSAYHHRKRP